MRSSVVLKVVASVPSSRSAAVVTGVVTGTTSWVRSDSAMRARPSVRPARQLLVRLSRRFCTSARLEWSPRIGLYCSWTSL
jgi:hypothetical protein